MASKTLIGKPASQPIVVNNLNTIKTLSIPHLNPSDLDEDRTTLVAPIVDATGSLAHLADVVRDEYNKTLRAFQGSALHETILVSGVLFNTKPTILHGYVRLPDATLLDHNNYNPDDLTALFDAVYTTLTVTEQYVKQQLIPSGSRVKVVVPIFTDGMDNCSKIMPQEVSALITDLLKQEIWNIGVISFGTGYAHTAAQLMGIPAANVREFGNDEKSIRHGFGLGSSTVIGHSQTNIGGSQSFFTA